MIDRITVLDGNSRATVAAADGEKLDGWLGRAGVRGKDNVRQIEPGMRTLAYMNLALDAAPASSILHRIDFHFATGEDQAPKQITSATARVDPRPPVVLGPPLRGGPWVAVYAPEMERGHRRVIYATEGSARIPGRFAIDWMRIDENGRMAPDGATRLDAFYGHGAEVLAVADATVAAVRDDVVEAETVDKVPKVSIADASGNYVALDLGGGRFAFYEHLQRGIRVRPGQRVKRGDVIGRLGLTGQGTAPHLHLHVADRNSLLGGEGLPFVIKGAGILGGYPSITAFGRGGPWMPFEGSAPAEPFTPGPNMVVRLVMTGNILPVSKCPLLLDFLTARQH